MEEPPKGSVLIAAIFHAALDVSTGFALSLYSGVDLEWALLSGWGVCVLSWPHSRWRS